MNPHPQRVCHKEESNLNFAPAIRATYTGYGWSSLYANLTRVVNKRKASLLGLDVGSHPVLVSCQQHLVQLSSL